MFYLNEQLKETKNNIGLFQNIITCYLSIFVIFVVTISPYYKPISSGSITKWIYTLRLLRVATRLLFQVNEVIHANIIIFIDI